MTERVLPTGTITFLFSDIEGSTRLVQQLGPAAFADVLEQHNRILREAFARHGGTERGTQGDSFLVMFPEAPAAIAAATDVQRVLHATAWPQGAAIRVRMGLHTGLGTLGGDDYVGSDINRAARIAAAAHGGQVLISDATRTLVEEHLDAGISLRRLGEHRLRDLARPERLHQLLIDGLSSDFPPIRTLERSLGNLPVRLTSYIGREHELETLAGLVATNRLVTLTGPGGTGKTSLAIELGRTNAALFEHGAWFVSLETTDDSRLVASAIATGIGLHEAGTSTPAERLKEFLSDRSILLLLDNFEQVLPAASLLVDLLRAAPSLRIVVTSRAPLRLSAEQEYHVAPLPLPEPGSPGPGAAGPSPAGPAAADSDALRLFSDRAARVRPGYRLNADDLPAAIEICRRLDGLPLGIELAASRMALLPADTIAKHLSRRLDLPGSGATDLPVRQQTLQAAIGWSYDLLGEPERRLFERVSVFAGGCRLEEAEEVCGPPAELGEDVIDGLSTLVNHSLVVPIPGLDGARFRLLATVRMFAAERLADQGDQARTRRRHADSYLAMAEAIAPQLPGRGQALLLDRLAAEHDNLRTAVDWAVEIADPEIGLRLAAALWRYWQIRGHLDEGRASIERILAIPGADAPTPLLAAALGAAGGIAWWRADVQSADGFYREQVDLARSIGEPQGLADALLNRAFTAIVLEAPAVAEGMLNEAARLFEATGDERGLARSQWGPINLVLRVDPARAREGLEMLRERFLELEDDYYAALVTVALAWTAIVTGDLATGARRIVQALRIAHELGDVAGQTVALREVAVFLQQSGLPRQSATVGGAFQALCQRYGVRPPAVFDEQGALISGPADPSVPTLSEDELAAATAEGSAMTLDEAVDYSIGLIEDVRDPPP